MKFERIKLSLIILVISVLPVFGSSGDGMSFSVNDFNLFLLLGIGFQ